MLVSIILLTALPPPPPTPRTLMRQGDEEPSGVINSSFWGRLSACPKESTKLSGRLPGETSAYKGATGQIGVTGRRKETVNGSRASSSASDESDVGKIMLTGGGHWRGTLSSCVRKQRKFATHNTRATHMCEQRGRRRDRSVGVHRTATHTHEQRGRRRDRSVGFHRAAGVDNISPTITSMAHRHKAPHQRRRCYPVQHKLKPTPTPHPTPTPQFKHECDPQHFPLGLLKTLTKQYSSREKPLHMWRAIGAQSQVVDGKSGKSQTTTAIDAVAMRIYAMADLRKLDQQSFSAFSRF